MKPSEVPYDVIGFPDDDTLQRCTSDGIMMRELSDFLENPVQAHPAEPMHSFHLIDRLCGSPIPDGLRCDEVFQSLGGARIVPDQLFKVRPARIVP